MSFLDRLRPWFLPIALLPVLLLADLYEPASNFSAFWLVIYGVWVGETNLRLNPRPDAAEDVQPWLPWNRLGAGEKLEYLLPAMLPVVLGALLTSLALLGDVTGLTFWLTLTVGLGMTGSGVWEFHHRWCRRWAALESE
jgi:hypothetical protein